MNTRTFAKCFGILAVLGLFAACGGDGTAESSDTAITAQPTDQSVVAGTTATFDVVARNATGYQWQRSTNNGVTFTDVSGATVASHTTAVTTLADSGTQYRVVVSGASNDVTSSAVTLTVTAVIVAPGISVHPAAQIITAGQDVSFTVTAGGSSLNYQWQRSTDGGANFTNIAGQTNATLTLTAVPLTDNAHQFRVVVSNSVGSVTSNAALVTVNPAQTVPAFSTQPVNQSVVAPATATFNVVATGTPSPTLQWQLSTNAGGSFTDIATTSSYTTAATVAGDNGNQYRVIATNTAGATTSSVATLSVTLPAAPSFATHPANVTITEGQSAQFTVAVSGTPTPTLQWQLSTDSGANWSNITGETGTVFNVTGAALANNGRQFRAVASNSVSTANSNAAVLTVLSKTWGTTVLIETDNVGDAYSPQIAINASGNAMAVWRQFDGTRFNIWANRFIAGTGAGTGWGTAELIETDNSDDAYSPQIAIDTNGNALAVWYQFGGTNNNIWANRFIAGTGAGTGWGTATLIETDNAGRAYLPQIAMDTNGNALAVWSQDDGTGYDEATGYHIMANRYTAGTGWGTAARIETDNAGSADYPQIAIDANGNALAVWQQYDGARYDIRANRFIAGTGAGTGWGTPTVIETNNAGNAYFPQIAIDTNGNALAVWSQDDGTGTNIWANRFIAGTGAGTGWGAATLIETNNAGGTSSPQIATDTNGNALAVWSQSDGVRNYIVANRYTVGTGWGTASRIQIDYPGSSGGPQIAVDANGNALAVWSQYVGGVSHIVANRFIAGTGAGTGWGTAAPIETDNAGNASAPQIAINANGDAVAVWQQSDGTRYNIWANHFQ